MVRVDELLSRKTNKDMKRIAILLGAPGAVRGGAMADENVDALSVQHEQDGIRRDARAAGPLSPTAGQARRRSVQAAGRFAGALGTVDRAAGGGEPWEALRHYLQSHKVSEGDIGGPISNTLKAKYFIIHDTSTPNYADKPFPPDINQPTWLL